MSELKLSSLLLSCSKVQTSNEVGLPASNFHGGTSNLWLLNFAYDPSFFFAPYPATSRHPHFVAIEQFLLCARENCLEHAGAADRQSDPDASET